MDDLREGVDGVLRAAREVRRAPGDRKHVALGKLYKVRDEWAMQARHVTVDEVESARRKLDKARGKGPKAHESAKVEFDTVRTAWRLQEEAAGRRNPVQSAGG